jgi:hypothetical protein
MLANGGFIAKTRVFVSYDHSEDVRYKRLLQAWDANPEFDFEFDSRGPDVARDSTNAATIRQALTRMMKEATSFERDRILEALKNATSIY